MERARGVSADLEEAPRSFELTVLIYRERGDESELASEKSTPKKRSDTSTWLGQ